MKVRLGFAIASHMEPDIMLIDEVLAVGDMGFVHKCFNKMDEIAKNTALVFVSHNMAQVSRLCNEIMVMDHGKTHYHSNNITEGISKFYNLFNLKPGDFTNDGEIELEDIYIISAGIKSEKNTPIEIKYGNSFSVTLCLQINKTLRNPNIELMFYDKENRKFGEVLNFNNKCAIQKSKGKVCVTADFPSSQISQGVYSISIIIIDSPGNNRKTIFRMQSAIFFQALSNKHGWAPIQFEPDWQIND